MLIIRAKIALTAGNLHYLMTYRRFLDNGAMTTSKRRNLSFFPTVLCKKELL